MRRINPLGSVPTITLPDLSTAIERAWVSSLLKNSLASPLEFTRYSSPLSPVATSRLPCGSKASAHTYFAFRLEEDAGFAVRADLVDLGVRRSGGVEVIRCVHGQRMNLQVFDLKHRFWFRPAGCGRCRPDTHDFAG